MKNSSDTIGNRTHGLPAYSAVPQPTAQTRAPCHYVYRSLNNSVGAVKPEPCVTGFKVM